MITREVRIVVGMLCLSAATFVWFNVFNRPGLETFAVMAQEVPTPLPVQEEVVAPTEEPLPETVTLSLSSTPKGASVTLDGEPLPLVTPFEALEIPAVEESLLRVTLDGYVPYEGPLNLSFNRVTSASISSRNLKGS